MKLSLLHSILLVIGLVYLSSEATAERLLRASRQLNELSELPDGSLCDIDTTCSQCENGPTFYLEGDQQQQYICGTAMADGTICSVQDNTCRLCEHGYFYDALADENVCGHFIELADGSLCDVDTTCSHCENGYTFYFEGNQQQHICGTETADGTICRLDDNTCHLCENGHHLDVLADAYKCGSQVFDGDEDHDEDWDFDEDEWDGDHDEDWDIDHNEDWDFDEDEWELDLVVDPIRVCINFGGITDGSVVAWSIKEVDYPYSIISQGNPENDPSALESDGCYIVHGTYQGVTYELRMIDHSDSGTVSGVVKNNGQTLAEIHHAGPELSQAPFQVY